jgi:hypothetical protein
MVVSMVLRNANGYIISTRIVVALQLRCACILGSNSSTRMITLMIKGNKLLVVDMVLCDANVYIISMWVALQGNELMVVGMVFPISGSVDVLVPLNWMPFFSSFRSTCMRMTSCVCKPKPLNQKYYSRWECMLLFPTTKLLCIISAA